MPIYEYQCNGCEHKFETLQNISDAPLSECPQCGEAGLRKLVSVVAFRLGGSGWYETDFKDKKKQKNLSSSDSQKPESDSGGGKTTEKGASDKVGTKKTGTDSKPGTNAAASD